MKVLVDVKDPKEVQEFIELYGNQKATTKSDSKVHVKGKIGYLPKSSKHNAIKVCKTWYTVDDVSKYEVGQQIDDWLVEHDFDKEGS